MENQNMIFTLRTKAGLSQDELAEKVYVTRQAVSRWENGETTPNTETLKLLSGLFGVSINTILGAPQRLVCRCCGMPLEEDSPDKEQTDDSNGDFCSWCYADGHFTMDFWQRYQGLGGSKMFEDFKQQLVEEFNTLQIEGMPKVEELKVLPGSFINLAYPLPNGRTAQLLDDNATYLGSQLECLFGGDRCFGLAAGMDFLLVCTYEAGGKNPELVLYKKR
ncbi:MAG: helix-turn-helix domain-containing protein [Oscillospiraceae bacterium]|nr:helix-turn-helix domain-containing protein [Oscillospiraceae bacterium]